MFETGYTAALQRLHDFVPKAGRDYASKRNYDDTAHVSALSPYIRHRIITEEDVIRATLGRHSLQAAEKFIQEVYWRTYWKGWLEMRPAVWDHYKADLRAALHRTHSEAGLRQAWEAACKGDTGIACFDHWAHQLAQTGYLHNHARMWFASIWVFTLRLPWVLGADFFMRHLIDGDPASNTLSWRWVSGLQTVGKTYLARPDNIAKYTEGRFRPTGLAAVAPPLEGLPHPTRTPLPVSDTITPGKRTGLLITEEDKSIGWLLDQFTPDATAIIQTTQARSPLMTAQGVQDFVAGGLADCAGRYQARLGHLKRISTDALSDWIATHELEQVVTSYLPVGPTRDALSGHDLRQIIRPYDSSAWPHATHGFFRFKEKIPKLIGDLRGLATV
ncbi:FAD-binding domain-containing protein [Yoonia sediminilitoris]|uniref:Deoxyribodipyrimidine photo-lyase n=1 Tax=Yoonia sediminilitoris TaxID=1286148 RepID=A0A2T6KQN7_9RHOB|nr:FAD-binding domain-containing protein [Yoonia sediminilitoris]PUB18871.1 deoxyribodipyrimidine photo-lyase [Yoonia sediminilitoris]RCW99039.1 deoxyribodipyrimidine photo-lyase [Yoonia sediminilitoris]